MRIVITGGHLTPAYSFSEVALEKNDQLFMIGALPKTATEAKELNRLGIGYDSIVGVKLDRYHPFASLLKLPLLLYSIIQSLVVLSKFKPNVVVSFGSYTAVPVHIAAWVLGIPSALHEQTRTIGLANKINSLFANICCVSYQESTKFLPYNKTKIVGNLLRKEIWKSPDSPSFSITSTKPIIFVTGGNQGSKAILENVCSIIPKFQSQYQFIIQQGRQKLPAKDLQDVITRSWFSAADISWLLHHAAMVISRAGANTVSEIMVAGIPSILIPLPKASNNEQYINALKLQEKKASILLPQSELTPDRLIDSIQEIKGHYEEFKHNALQLKSYQHQDATCIFYNFVKAIQKV